MDTVTVETKKVVLAKATPLERIQSEIDDMIMYRRNRLLTVCDMRKHELLEILSPGSLDRVDRIGRTVRMDMELGNGRRVMSEALKAEMNTLAKDIQDKISREWPSKDNAAPTKNGEATLMETTQHEIGAIIMNHMSRMLVSGDMHSEDLRHIQTPPGQPIPDQDNGRAVMRQVLKTDMRRMSKMIIKSLEQAWPSKP